MAPQRNNERPDRNPGNTGTIPKTKVRNNCNVPQEAVTPTRRDMASNIVTTSLDWVPVSEYNSRSNYNQSRKPTNNTTDHELTDLDNCVPFEGGFSRFAPVRPQPRVFPQNRDNTIADHNDDGAGSTASGYSHHGYNHSMPNGLIPHSNHAAAAVMIVNPTTPNAVAGNMPQPFNTPGNQNRNNLTRNLNQARNNFEGNSNTSNHQTPPVTNSRSGAKTVNLINNMYDSGQGSSNNINDNHSHRESARSLGEAIVAACPDAAAVERRLGQIREYIRVTSSLVDTMRNSEDEAYIEHTKEEYDELVEMVMQLKKSESKLEDMLVDKIPDNIEVPTEELEDSSVAPNQIAGELTAVGTNDLTDTKVNSNSTCVTTCKSSVTDNSIALRKVTNVENEQLNKTLHLNKTSEVPQQICENNTVTEQLCDIVRHSPIDHLSKINECVEETENSCIEIKEISSPSLESKKDDQHLNEVLRQNILSCVEKVARIEELKHKNTASSDSDNQDIVVRPMSVQSNGSAYSENELWQNEIKNKMELSEQRLAALKQQQKRLIKYQTEAKHQLEEMNRARQADELCSSASHDNLMQNQLHNGGPQHNRIYAANQIGVATTLPHASEMTQTQQNIPGGYLSNISNDSHIQEERFAHRNTNIASSEEAAGGRDSDEDDGLNDRGRQLTLKLRELQLKKQHMENLVSEFQKLQMATRLDSSHNTYSSSGEESLEEEPARKCNKLGGSNNKNEDPFKLMEIKAIKTALQKTKDLMRSVENYEAEHLSGIHEDPFQIPVQTPSNIHDNKSEGGGSGGAWSREGSMCRVRNSLPQRHKFTNEQHSHHQQGHEANIASLQELAQELHMETEKIMSERARLKDIVSNKEFTRKQKKVNEEVRPSTSGVPGPAERRQMELRSLLAEKQKELEALLKKEEVLSITSETQKVKTDSQDVSIANQSYNSEPEEPDLHSDQLLVDTQNSRESENFRGGGDSGLGGRSINTLPSHLGSTYASDSDNTSRTKSNQRNRGRRRQQQERPPSENIASPSSILSQNIHIEPRMDQVNVNTVPPMSQSGENQSSMPYPHLPPPCWSNNKSNQDMRANQFTQNSHSQTMDRLLGTPQMSYPPSMPFNMLMPYGMVGGCGCGCGLWGAWCWQQIAMQQREIHQLRDQLNHLEERWRAETASHTLNNQVPPGNRANNYWDNFRSYSRQNLLSTSNKTNADGHFGIGPAHNPHPLVERSHNTLHPSTSSTPPCNTPKRNINAASSSQNSVTHTNQANSTDEINRHGRSNVIYERSLSFSSAPDVLNVNQNNDTDAAAQARNFDESVNINRQHDIAPNALRNLNITQSIPEIIQSHANNINTTSNSLNNKKKSSSKLPAKNSSNRRNTLDYSQTSNINITSTMDAPNPNLASTSREGQDKGTTKLFDFLRENVYSEVTALIGVNESHPDFLIQLFRELQLISSDPLRQRVLQSIRNVLSQYPSIMENDTNDIHPHQEALDVSVPEAVTTTTSEGHSYPENPTSLEQNACAPNTHIDNGIVRFLLIKSGDVCTSEFLDTLCSIIMNSSTGRQSQLSKKRLIDVLSKYEGSRVCDVSGDIVESLSLLISNESGDLPINSVERSEPSILQDVAGSLNLFRSSDNQLHQMNECPYDMWPAHVHMDLEPDSNKRSSSRSAQDGMVDLINCSEMQNGDLAEADQSHTEGAEQLVEGGVVDALPDVVDTDEATPTEAEAEWLGLDRVPTRLHMEESSENQKG